MKYICLLLLSLGLAQTLSAQTLLNDAKNLSELFNEGTAATQNRAFLKRSISISFTQLQTLTNYFPDSVDVSTLDEDQLVDMLETVFANNPFIRMEVTDQNLMGMTKLEGVLGTEQGSAAAGFSVAGFADGLSRFLVKRTKQELSQAFFEDFKNTIKNDSLVGFFCPYTRQHLLLVDQDVYQFKNYLEGLRESFISDMTALPGNTELFLRNPELCPTCTEKANGKVMVDMLHLAQQLVNGEAPIDMIDYLARSSSAIQTADKATDPVLYNMAGGFRFLNLVSEALRNTESTDSLMPWYTGREVREMFKDPKLFRLFLGLVWQKAEGVSFAGSTVGATTIQMREILNKASQSAAALDNWRNALASFGESTHALQRSIQASNASQSAVSDDFFRYSQALIDLLQNINQTGRLILDRKDDLIPQEYIFLMRQCNSLYFNVRQRNYTGAISNVIYCLNLLGTEKESIATMLKYANFVASIAEANSPEEVENAIELFALPPGSSRMKKQPGRFSVALNAYTGLAGGNELLDGAKSPKTFGAITAPVGLSLSWGLGRDIVSKTTGDKMRKSMGSLGLFIPLIDVGAVTAFRFQDSTSQNLPELTWENILSPGLYLVYDVPGKWPIAFGVGGQAGPGLRKVLVDGNEINRSAVRYGAFVTVDIPFTYFYLGKGKEKKTSN